jgi:demethylmenaquinone methyltransferase/2-methoxy-6-polyprenyl-1,4-benzoquinol methylase
MRSLIEAVAHHASDRGNHPAIIEENGCAVTYRELLERAMIIATAIETPTPRSIIAISLSSGPDLWAAVVGVSIAGHVPALLPYPLPATIATKATNELPQVKLINDAWIRHVRTEPHHANGTSRVDPARATGLILLSSGTTGASRFILRSPEAVDRIGATLLEEELCVPTDLVGSFLPMSHAYGFEHALLAPILSGATVRALGAFSVETATKALANGIHSLPIVPIMARALAESGCTAPALRSAVVAGTSLSAETRSMFETQFGRSLVDLYGASELGTIWLDRGQGGRPVRGVEVAIKHPELHEIANHSASTSTSHEGEILVRSACMYDASFDATGSMIPAPLSGWFQTGDLGRRQPSGGYQVTGRIKLVFDVSGLKVNPLEVEHAAETHPKVKRALVYPLRASAELFRVGLAIEVQGTRARVSDQASATAPTLSELRSHLESLVPQHALPRSLIVTDNLPKTPSGKLLRDQPPTTDHSVAQEASEVRDPAANSSIPPVLRRPKGLERQADREQYTKKLFDETAKGYDHSSGAAFLRSGRWYRRRMLMKAGLREGSSHLDVGSGTGLCAALGQTIVGPRGRVVALDPSTGMLEVAKRRGVREIVEGRAEKLPFPNATFDVVSMSYMLRHIEDLSCAFSEARRVLKPGGRIVIFEVTRPESFVPRVAFDVAMWWVVPGVGVVASGRPSTFPMMRYWAETIEAAARPARIVEALDRSGFVGTRHLLELGVFSCYRGTAPIS